MEHQNSVNNPEVLKAVKRLRPGQVAVVEREFYDVLRGTTEHRYRFIRKLSGGRYRIEYSLAQEYLNQIKRLHLNWSCFQSIKRMQEYDQEHSIKTVLLGIL